MSYLNSALSYVVPILLIGTFSTSVNADRVGPDGYRMIDSAPAQNFNTGDNRFRPMSPPGYRPIQRFRPIQRPVMARAQMRPYPRRVARVAPSRWHPVQRVAPVLRGYGAYPGYGYRAPTAYPRFASRHNNAWSGRRMPFDPIPNPYPMVRNRYQNYAPRYARMSPNWSPSRYAYAGRPAPRPYAYAQRPVYQPQHKPRYRRAPAYQPAQQMTYVRAPYQSRYASRDMHLDFVPAGYQRLARR